MHQGKAERAQECPWIDPQEAWIDRQKAWINRLDRSTESLDRSQSIPETPQISSATDLCVLFWP
jgi:hypothetical protein